MSCLGVSSRNGWVEAREKHWKNEKRFRRCHAKTAQKLGNYKISCEDNAEANPSQPLILLTLSSSPEVEEYQVFGFWIPLPSISASKSFSQNAPLGANWCQACSSQKGVPWAIRIMCGGVTSFVVKKSCIVAVVVAQVLIPTLMIQKVWILSKPTCISHEDRSRYGCTGNDQTWADRLT